MWEEHHGDRRWLKKMTFPLQHHGFQILNPIFQSFFFYIYVYFCNQIYWLQKQKNRKEVQNVLVARGAIRS